MHSGMRYLASLMVAVALVGVGLVGGAPSAAVAAEPDTIQELVNRDRAANGQAPLFRNPQMDAVAAAWANQMAANRSISHNPNFSSKIPAGWTRAGENVAYGQPTGSAVHGAWMNSAGHRANILGDYTDIGIAFVTVAGTTWSVEVFAKYPGRVAGPYYVAGSQEFVKAMYDDILNRAPAENEVTGWATVLTGGSSPVSVASGFINSDEYRLQRINGAYDKVLGRRGEAAGMNGWLREMQRGTLGPDDVEKSFLGSPEYMLRSGGTVETFVTSMYRDLLNRTPAAPEVSGWSAIARSQSRDAVVARIWNSLETAQNRVSNMYISYLGRAPEEGSVEGWARMAISGGDGAVRWSIIGSPEYWMRANARF